MIELPHKRSELIRLAVADLEKCEHDSRFIIDMSCWIISTRDTCAVCLAGSVMAQTLNMDDRKTKIHIFLRYFPEMSLKNAKKLEFLNQVRSNLCPYTADKKIFKKQILDIADYYSNNPSLDGEEW